MIDTHAHLHLINRNTEDVLAAAKEAGVYHVVQVAIDLPSIHRNLNEYALMPNCSITGGIHPLSVFDSLELDEVLAVLNAHVEAFVAIGEIGLDYKYGKDNMALQKIFFESQLAFARAHEKPVIIHSRHCDEDMLNIVNQYSDVKKVFHCYATNYAFFEALEGDQNYISFTGMVTYAKKGKVINAMRKVPMNRLMIETDAPYLIPRGVDVAQNSPEHVGHIAQHIADIREMSFEDVIDQTAKTAQSFFSI
tara:strand:- start:14457 stop:15206 length:750 start_codon:yes stop_codon:yes gene_type:complete